MTTTISALLHIEPTQTPAAAGDIGMGSDGIPLVYAGSSQKLVVTTDTRLAGTREVHRSMFRVYFYNGSYFIDLGTLTTSGTLAEVTTNTRSKTRFSSTTGTAGLYLAATCAQPGMNLRLSLRLAPYSAGSGNGRFWIGFISTNGPGNGATPTAPFYGVSCDPAGGETVWYATTADGTSISRTSTGVTYDVTHEYAMEISMTASGISVKVADATNGVDVETVSAVANTGYAPTSGTEFRPYCVGIRTAGTWGIEMVALSFETTPPNIP